MKHSPLAHRPPILLRTMPKSSGTPLSVRTFHAAMQSESARLAGFERVQQHVDFSNVVQTAILKSRQGQLPGLPAGQPPTPIQQFMALQAMPVMHVEAELQHSQSVLMTLLKMQMERTGMVFQTLSNLSKARHDIRRNSISNIR